MDTNYNSANVLHALFAIIERTACLEKLFAEGNYCIGHGLPSRLLDVWHVTCFRVYDWVTLGIRGAGRELYRRRVFFLYSRPATRIIASCWEFSSEKSNLPRKLLEVWPRNGRRICSTICARTPGRRAGSVSLVLFNFSLASGSEFWMN